MQLVATTALALAVKIAGNKLLLKLIAKQNAFVTDTLHFGRELVTALLVRVLQLSIPDPSAA